MNGHTELMNSPTKLQVFARRADGLLDGPKRLPAPEKSGLSSVVERATRAEQFDALP
jgi:hypothetical protein